LIGEAWQLLHHFLQLRDVVFDVFLVNGNLSLEVLPLLRLTYHEAQSLDDIILCGDDILE
jgi:hypothetical protein